MSIIIENEKVPRMKVYVAQPIQPNGIEILEKIAEVVLHQTGRPSTRSAFLSEIKDADAVILPWQTEVMDAEAISSFLSWSIGASSSAGKRSFVFEAARAFKLESSFFASTKG
jgi:phosphoglycerate dehydrogenase-like enzyme